MTTPSPDEVEQLLLDWSNGDQAAFERLVPLVEGELHRIAAHYMKRESSEHILQADALVNEAYIRLLQQNNVRWQNRAHFFAIAAQIMRRILLNYARDRHRVKRGGHAVQVPLSEVAVVGEEKSAELIALDEALVRLAEFDPHKARVVELRYFGGLTVVETAEVLQVSVGTVQHDVRYATAWLRRELTQYSPASEETSHSDSHSPSAPHEGQETKGEAESEKAESVLIEAWANRELIATLMGENWTGLKLLAQLRLTPNVGAAYLASAVGVHPDIVESLLLRLVLFGALEEQRKIFTLTSRGTVLLSNLEAAIGKNL
jgi:RNA polymerase sigma-70 factor (ECF subfamily)